MANKQTVYTRDFRARQRRGNRVYLQLREMALDHPELGPLIREAEAAVDEKHGAVDEKHGAIE